VFLKNCRYEWKQKCKTTKNVFQIKAIKQSVQKKAQVGFFFLLNMSCFKVGMGEKELESTSLVGRMLLQHAAILCS